MKKSLVVLLTVVMLLVSAFPVFAARNSSQGPGNLDVLTGTIEAIDGSIITIKVMAGKMNEDPCTGYEQPIFTTDTTRYLLRVGDYTSVPLERPLEQDDKVSVLVDDGYTATRVTVDPLLELIGCE